MRTVMLLLVLTCSFCFVAADVIECDNGDRYNGKVLSMDEKIVKLQNDITGTLTIPRKRIVSISFRAAQVSAPKTATNAPSLNARGGVNVDPAAVERIQNEYLAGANPEANQLFQEMVRGLATGQLGVGDVRAKAESTLRDLRQMQKELGDDEAGALLDSYGTILENFLRQAPAGTNSLRRTPPPAPPVVVPDVEE